MRLRPPVCCMCCRVFQCVAVCSNVLQYVAVRCSMIAHLGTLGYRHMCLFLTIVKVLLLIIVKVHLGTATCASS